jgi:UDP-N-acetylglucosamine 2-epimerase
MKIVTIIGARPQFIKAATVSRAIAEYNNSLTKDQELMTEVLVHTGQHYDKLSLPSYCLKVGKYRYRPSAWH